MKPEDIQGRDFLVGLRGYDKDEVREFLTEVASEHAALLSEVDQLRHAPASAAPDDFETLGASVAAILRSAKESASEITGAADVAAAQVRDEAESYAASLRQQAEEERANADAAAQDLRAQASAEAEERRRSAQVALEEARAEAERIVREATERANTLGIEAEARIRNQTESMLAEAAARAAEVARHEEMLRQRLLEAADEVGLALLALGESAPPTSAAPTDIPVDVPTEHDGEPVAGEDPAPS